MLSQESLALLRAADGRIEVDDSNRQLCRELAGEGLLIVGHSFRDGREAFYVPTPMGRKLATALARFEPSPEESASPRP